MKPDFVYITPVMFGKLKNIATFGKYGCNFQNQIRLGKEKLSELEISKAIKPCASILVIGRLSRSLDKPIVNVQAFQFVLDCKWLVGQSFRRNC